MSDAYQDGLSPSWFGTNQEPKKLCRLQAVSAQLIQWHEDGAYNNVKDGFCE